ncbi:MAG TPA: glycosyltransferase family 39 protein [Caulobacteraceae bacterium]|nr:glycosyltransferase family 39 protein [Caulobacteraceae bacterium]
MNLSARLKTLTPAAWLAVLVAAVTLGRLAAAAAVPLTEDEAYYRLWAAQPQFGYYDHPPMIAWWIWAGTHLVGDNRLGIRLAPCLSAGAVTWLTFDLARRLGAASATALRAAVWFNATILVGVGGILATPDAPNMLFWAACLSCLARTSERGGRTWWLAAGAAAGLASLSKYSALFLAPGVLLWLILDKARRKDLAKPWPWLACLIAGGLFALNVVWNARHHWETFTKQFGRVAPQGFAPQFLLELLAGQALLLTPFIAYFVLKGAGQILRRRPTATVDLRLPFWSAVPFAAYLVVHSLHDRVQAHWPFPLYSGLAIIAAVTADASELTGWGLWIRRRADRVGLVVSAVVLIHMSFSTTDIASFDPMLSLRGWPQFTGEVERLRAAEGAAWVGTLSYGETAELDAGKAIHAPIVELRERDRYPPADGSWRADLSKPGLVIDIDRRALSADLDACFASVRPLPDMVRGSGANANLRYAAVLVGGSKPGLVAMGCGKAPPARQRVW